MKDDLARFQEDFSYQQQLHSLTVQERSAGEKLSYERALSEKGAVETELASKEASHHLSPRPQAAQGSSCENDIDRSSATDGPPFAR